MHRTSFQLNDLKMDNIYIYICDIIDRSSYFRSLLIGNIKNRQGNEQKSTQIDLLKTTQKLSALEQ